MAIVVQESNVAYGPLVGINVSSYLKLFCKDKQKAALEYPYSISRY